MTNTPLHVPLAIVADKKKQANILIDEARVLFGKKADHFDGMTKIYKSFDENGSKLPPESKEIVTTVSEKLQYLHEQLADPLNVIVTIEEANSSGKVRADLQVGDLNFGTFSATSLLAIESWLERLRSVYSEIPTLDTTRVFIPDTKSGRPGVYTSGPEVKFRTEKQETAHVIVPATEKHPAQIQYKTIDAQVGQYDTTYLTGKITPAQKAELLSRVETLIAAVKQARAKANMTEITPTATAEKMFKFLQGNIV